MLKGGLIGFGAIAEKAHVPAFAGRDDMYLVAAAESNPERRQAAAKAVPGMKVYGDYKELLREEKLDFVVVCTPPHLHFAAALPALQRGLHVLCEKPLTLDVEELETLAAEAKRADKALFTVHNWAYAPQWREFEKLARAAGSLDAASILVKRTQPSVSATADDWRRDLSRAGGGILVDHGWHNLYLLIRLFDAEPELADVRLARGASGADEEAKVVLTFGKARADLFMTWRSSTRSNYAAAHGRGGTVELHDDRIVVSKDGREAITRAFDAGLSAGSAHPEWLAAMLPDFLDAMKGGPARAANLREARLCASLLREAYARETAGTAS